MSTPPTSAAGDPPRLLVLFPGALGDFLCCWAALDGLRTANPTPLTLVARPAWLEVLAEDAVRPVSIDRREVADLFARGPLAPATIALFGGHARVESWTGYGEAGVAERLAEASGGRVAVHPFRAMRAGEHAAVYYARCLGGAPPIARLEVRPAAIAWAAALWRAHALPPRTLVVHAGSGSPRKTWEGASAAAASWRAGGGAVLALEGPAETTSPPGVAADLTLRSEPLDRIAAVLQRAGRYLGNDSGISHLAGLVGARGAVVFGPSDPRAWRPLGDTLAVVSAPDTCRECGVERLCIHRVPVEHVLEALA